MAMTCDLNSCVTPDYTHGTKFVIWFGNKYPLVCTERSIYLICATPVIVV